MAELNEERVQKREQARLEALAAWVVGKVRDHETTRDSEYKSDWERYFRVTLGVFGEADRDRRSERSRLVSPATAAAVASIRAEAEEALLNKPQVVDFRDNEMDLFADKADDMEIIKNLIHYDLEEANFRNEASKAIQIGAIWGTGFLKAVVELVEEIELPVDRNAEEGVPVKKLKVTPVALRPDKVVIDEDAEELADMSFWAHVDWVPRHILKAANPGAEITKSQKEQYFDQDPISDVGSDVAAYIEYYGLVPSNLIEEVTEEDLPETMTLDRNGNEVIETLEPSEVLIEAVVKVVNDSTVLTASRNPYWRNDRLLTAFRHEYIPGRFWGRGVPEQSNSPQRALDASLRARMDAMAYTVHPMLAINTLNVDLRSDFKIGPGRKIPVQGSAADSFSPIRFGDLDPNSFAQTGDLERLVQTATGGLDAIGPTNIDPSRASTGGISMVSSSLVKRAASVIRNIGDELIAPFAEMAARIYMQNDTDRYPLVDLRFKASAGIGLVAKELEKQELSKMLQAVQPGGTEYYVLLKAIFELSQLGVRAQAVELMNKRIEASLQPQKLTPEQELALRQVKVQEIRAEAELERILTDRMQSNSDIALTDAKTIKTLAEAEAEEAGTQMGEYQSLLEELKNVGSELDANDETRGDERRAELAVRLQGLAADSGDAPDNA